MIFRELSFCGPCEERVIFEVIFEVILVINRFVLSYTSAGLCSKTFYYILTSYMLYYIIFTTIKVFEQNHVNQQITGIKTDLLNKIYEISTVLKNWLILHIPGVTITFLDIILWILLTSLKTF